jgi:Na+-transporting methylmalonyl-CoA/oxaloacetate decarboxylase gamma subunit
VRYPALTSISSARFAIVPSLSFQIETELMAVLSGLNHVSTIAMQRGVSIALSGMLIVFIALLLIALFLEALPRLLDVFAKYLPETEVSHGSHSHQEDLVPDDEAVIAGLGFILHTEFQNQLPSRQSLPKS